MAASIYIHEEAGRWGRKAYPVVTESRRHPKALDRMVELLIVFLLFVVVFMKECL